MAHTTTARIRIGIVGYGNLGRGVELSLVKNPDLELVGIFTRRDPADLTPALADTKTFALADLPTFVDKIDVLILCGGSKSDLPTQSPELATQFNIVDSFDTHALVPQHYAAVDAAAQSGAKVALISAGWDPGMFSLNRLYGEALVPDGDTYTFWGRGLSQGHSDAVRRVPGVAGGVQYTLPSEDGIAQVRSGSRPELTTRQKHTRQCFIVLEEGADPAAVTDAIVTMPNYFAEYDTEVNFISAEELAEKHSAMPHGGFVIRSGNSTDNTNQVIEYRLQLDSNPEFTASVLVAYSRAVHRLSQKGKTGAITVFDVAPGLLSPKSREELRKELL